MASSSVSRLSLPPTRAPAAWIPPPTRHNMSVPERLPPVAISEVFPVVSEQFIVQLNPMAMVKHLNRPELVEELQQQTYGKYLAVLRRYHETPSAVKPWIMAELILLREVNPPPDEDDHEDDPENPGSSSNPLTKEELDEAMHPKERDTFLARHEKPVFVMHSVMCRLRTMPCKLPRWNPHLMPRATFDDLVSSVSGADVINNPAPGRDVPCRNITLRSALRPEFQRLRDYDRKAEKPEWKEDTMALFLFPHFDVDYNLDQPTLMWGKSWEDEHTQVISTLMYRNVKIPERALIPLHLDKATSEESIKRRRWYIEHPNYIHYVEEYSDIRAFLGEKGAIDRLRLLGKPGVKILYHPRRLTPSGLFKKREMKGLVRPQQKFLWEVQTGPEKPTTWVWILAPAGTIRGVDAMDKRIPLPPPSSRRFSLSAVVGSCGLLTGRFKAASDDKPYVPFVKEIPGLHNPVEPDEDDRRHFSRDDDYDPYV